MISNQRYDLRKWMSMFEKIAILTPTEDVFHKVIQICRSNGVDWYTEGSHQPFMQGPRNTNFGLQIRSDHIDYVGNEKPIILYWCEDDSMNIDSTTPDVTINLNSIYLDY